jgi:hypothetical protein
MAVWLIITGFGLDNWISTFLYTHSQSIFSRALHPWLPRTRSILISDLIRFCTTYIVSRWTHTKHIRCPATDICESHRKHFFLYCCIYCALHSNGSYPTVACVFVAAGMRLPSRCLEMALHVTAPCSPLKVNRLALLATCFMLVSLLACSSTLKMEVTCSRKHPLAFRKLHGIISEKTDLFITTAMRTSDPTNIIHVFVCPFYIYVR